MKRHQLIRPAIMTGAIMVAAILLLEAFWLAELRASTYGLSVRNQRVGWWTCGEIVCLSGVFACNILFAVLLGNLLVDRANPPLAVFGTVAISNRCPVVFIGFIIALAATILVALGFTVLTFNFRP